MNLQLLYSFTVLLISPVDAQDFDQRLKSNVENTYGKWQYEDDEPSYDRSRRQYRKHKTVKPYPSSPQAQFNPKIEEIFNDIANNFEQIQRTCKSRKSCLKEEKHLLIDKSRVLGRQHPVYSHLQNILNLITRYSKTDIYISQLYLFKHMSAQGQQEYRSGLRIQSLRHGYESHREPPHYIVDDILNFAIQQVEKNHQHCHSRSQCLESDREILQNLARQLSPRDPSYKILMTSANELINQADQQLYNGLSLIAMYQHKGHKAASNVKFVSKEAQEWNDINRSKAQTHRQARMIDYSRPQPRSQQQPYQIQDDHHSEQRHSKRHFPYQDQQSPYYQQRPQQPFYPDEKHPQPYPPYQTPPHQVPQPEENGGFFSIITNLFGL